MKRYKWAMFDKQTGEKLDSGFEWAENQKDLTESVLKPVLETFRKSPDQVRFSVERLIKEQN